MEEPATPANGNLAKRWYSLAELILGSAVVVGYNVFGVLPNEVLVLILPAWLSVRFRDGGWRRAGLARPASWRHTLLFAMSAATLMQLSGFVTEPIAEWLGQPPAEVSDLVEQAKTLSGMLMLLALVWTFAAFGEEMVYRGYLLNRAADLGNRSRTADWLAVILISVLFGVAHWYKGPTGVMDSGVSGLILGSAYVATRRNLWVPILAHGLSNTASLLGIYFGLLS